MLFECVVWGVLLVDLPFVCATIAVHCLSAMFAAKAVDLSTMFGAFIRRPLVRCRAARSLRAQVGALQLAPRLCSPSFTDAIRQKGRTMHRTPLGSRHIRGQRAAAHSVSDNRLAPANVLNACSEQLWWNTGVPMPPHVIRPTATATRSPPHRHWPPSSWWSSGCVRSPKSSSRGRSNIQAESCT